MNKDIVINNDDFVFNFRVASVIRNKDKILVQVNKKAGHLTLPGGRCKFNEDTINTSIREFREETGIDTLFVKSLGIIENFFVSSFYNKKFHEILMVNEVKFKDRSNYLLDEIVNIESKKQNDIKFIWMSIDELKDLNFKPKVLFKAIESKEFVHLINKD